MYSDSFTAYLTSLTWRRFSFTCNMFSLSRCFCLFSSKTSLGNLCEVLTVLLYFRSLSFCGTLNTLTFQLHCGKDNVALNSYVSLSFIGQERNSVLVSAISSEQHFDTREEYQPILDQ